MRLIQKTVTLVSLPILALKLAVAAGFFLSYAGSVFYLGLLWHLCIAIHIFSDIVLLEASNNAA